MRKWLPWLLVVAALGFSAAVYNRLPEQIPTHWDANGVVNGWSSRAFGAFLMPGIMIVMALVLPQLPRIDPKRDNYVKFRGSYDAVIYAIITMLGVMHVLMLGAALGWPISMSKVTPLMVGALFVVLGNVLPRARPNWLFGIRTPWTLSNDRVWEKTHRLGGYLFVAAGIAIMALSLASATLALPVLIGASVVAAVVPLVYSYFAWKQETSRQ